MVTLTTVCCEEASDWDLLDRAEWLDPRDNMEAVEGAEWRDTLASSVSGVTCQRWEVRCVRKRLIEISKNKRNRGSV